MDWERMVEIEPRLAKLEKEADGAHRDGLPWFDLLKLIESDLAEAVGFLARQPALRSTRCVEQAHRHLTSVWAIGLEPAPALPSLAELERLSHV